MKRIALAIATLVIGVGASTLAAAPAEAKAHKPHLIGVTSPDYPIGTGGIYCARTPVNKPPKCWPIPGAGPLEQHG